MDRGDMGRFWDARAREDAFYFVDNTGTYRDADVDRFWAEGQRQPRRRAGRGRGRRSSPSDVVLDIGCGVGRLTRVLAERAAHVHAIDVSAEMLEQARELNGHLTNVTWHHGDGTTLHPVEDGSIDAVVSHVVFQHIPDPQITLGYVREIGRVLEPGGWAAFQISNDPALHRPTVGVKERLKAAVGRAPKGQDEPEWLGSAVDLEDLRATAAESDLDVAKVVGAGTQFCYVRTVPALHARYSQPRRRKNRIIATTTTTIRPMITQNASTTARPGRATFMPQMPEISVSGSRITLNAVSTRSTSFRPWEITDSLVDSRPSTTSLKFSSMSHTRSFASLMSSK